jgi:hypothetical protein
VKFSEVLQNFLKVLRKYAKVPHSDSEVAKKLEIIL